jgi:hypothetical protein
MVQAVIECCGRVIVVLVFMEYIYLGLSLLLVKINIITYLTFVVLDFVVVVPNLVVLDNNIADRPVIDSLTWVVLVGLGFVGNKTKNGQIDQMQ